MSLTSGARLGAYEVLALIGAGGMGEVYRARDTKLNRDVALKVLPELFALDPDRLARFKREAQLLASLNHPNIAAIYGLEDTDGIRALVLELVEGPTLADRIAEGPIPLEDALPVARQIAEALEAAHEQGIIHRDLKPANIKVRPDGTVKVLDFGLAKALDPAPQGFSPAELTNSPTMTAAGTRVGVIMGTAAYMAPEQARGKPVDKRADIWAFGCVLYEMLTAKRAFAGNEVSDTLAFIITKQPDWSALPANTPAPICKLLRRALEKDRKERLPDIVVARLEIKDALTAPSADVARGPEVSHRRREQLAWTVVAVLFVALVAALALGSTAYLSPNAADPQTMRFFVSPPDGWSLTAVLAPGGGSRAPLTISPDGHRLAFLARNAEGKDQLWIRPLDALASQALTGTEGASSPFWSPDSLFLGFFADGKLKKIDVSGGPPITVCESPDNRGGAWSRDGVIVFAPSNNGALQKVSAAGGVPTTATTTLAPGERHVRPTFLPDGRHFLYSVGSGRPVYIASLDSTDRALLLSASDSTNVLYAQGHLLFLRGTTLMAQTFDARRLALTGEAVPIAEQIQRQSNLAVGDFSASDSGVLAYQTGTGSGNSRLLWFDRVGKQTAVLGDQADYRSVELSPDRTRAAVIITDSVRGTRDIWLHDVARFLRTRFTFDPAEETASRWSPDGSRVIFNSNRKGRQDLFQKPSSGAGNEELVLESDRNKNAGDWSLDGRLLLYGVDDPKTTWDLWVLPLSADGKPRPFLQAEFSQEYGRFSPDGRWVAYRSNESGRFEVYVTPFPGPGGKWQISTAGGSFPRWRRDGKEIFYVTPDTKLMAAAVSSRGSAFEVGALQLLFETSVRLDGDYPYDVSADGQRFVVNTLVKDTTAAPITVVVNWTAALKK